MSAAATRNDLLLPRPPGGMAQGAALAVLAHLLLLLALTAAVQWRTSPSEPVSAELWSAVPQVAAPRPAEVAPPPPPPPPAPPPQRRAAEPPKPAAEPDAQIAIARQKAERERAERAARAEREKAEREKLEREKAEREKAERAKAEHAKAERERERREHEAEAKARERAERQAKAAEEKRLAEQRQKQLERMMSQAGTAATSSTGTAARDAGPSRTYAGRLVAAIKPNIVFTETLSGNPAAEVEVRAGPSGAILARRIVRSSGHKDWDEAVLRAIDRTGTLPRDTDGRVPPTIIVEFRPNE